MNIRQLIQRITFYISVPKCVNCKEKLDIDDRGLCKSCVKIYEEHKGRNCPRCANKLSYCSCSSDFLSKHGVKMLIKLFRYSKQEQASASNALIYSLKQDNREDVLDFLADELAKAISRAIDANKDKYVITNIPRRKKAIIEYGFDHAAMLAKRVAEKLDIEYRPLLISQSKKAQKSVIGEGRIANAKFSLRGKQQDLRGKTVILIDDIVTTGSSMSKCAAVIRKCNTRKVIGAVLGIAYKDSYTQIIDGYSAFK